MMYTEDDDADDGDDYDDDDDDDKENAERRSNDGVSSAPLIFARAFFPPPSASRVIFPILHRTHFFRFLHKGKIQIYKCTNTQKQKETAHQSFNLLQPFSIVTFVKC